MDKIIGEFYFKRTDSGNIVGEFSNNLVEINSTESADALDNLSDFTGEYNSTWQEDGIPNFAILTIEFKNELRKIYSLKWAMEEKIIYWGEALLTDGILVGNYRNFEM